MPFDGNINDFVEQNETVTGHMLINITTDNLLQTGPAIKNRPGEKEISVTVYKHNRKYPGLNNYNIADLITPSLKKRFWRGRGYGTIVRRRTGIGRRVDGSQPYRADMQGKALSCRSIIKTRHTLHCKKYMPCLDWRATSIAFRSKRDRILGFYNYSNTNSLKTTADTIVIKNNNLPAFITRLPPISGQST